MKQKNSDNKNMKKPTGRPKIEIDINQYKALMRLNPTLADTAAFFECSTDTIINWLEKNFGTRDFSAIRQQNMVHTRLTMIRTAVRLAEAGNTAVLIFCLKNLCGWTDKVDEKQVQQVIKLAYALPETKKEDEPKEE